MPNLIHSEGVRTVGEFQQQAINRGVVGLLAQAAEFSSNARDRRLEGPYLPISAYYQDPDTGIVTWDGALARGIGEGISACVAPFGLRSPDQEMRDIATTHNATMGEKNRAGPLLDFGQGDKTNIISASEGIGYGALLTAPSTLWRQFLESKEMTDWSDALPGTLLPDGSIALAVGKK